MANANPVHTRPKKEEEEDSIKKTLHKPEPKEETKIYSTVMASGLIRTSGQNRES
jgi:hypothetical protein